MVITRLIRRSAGALTLVLTAFFIGVLIPPAPSLAQSADKSLAPLFELQGADGPVSLQQHRGSVVYVDFWASWCAPCLRSFPWMDELQARHADKGLKIIAINLDSQRTDAADFLAQTRPEFLIAYDPAGETAKDYRVRGMPSSYLIGRDGTLLWQHIGFRTKDASAVERRLIVALEDSL